MIIDYEKLVLSCLLNNTTNPEITHKIDLELTPGDFTDKKHREIKIALNKILVLGLIPDPTELVTYSNDPEIGPYLRTLPSYAKAMGVESWASLPQWLEILKISGVLQHVKAVTTGYSNKLADLDIALNDVKEPGQLEQFLSEYVEKLNSANLRGRDTGYVHASVAIDEELERLDLAEQGIYLDTLDIGMPSLVSRLIPARGVLNVLAALTSAGKTQLSSIMALGGALGLKINGEQGHVCYNALEESRAAVIRRMACALANVPSKAVKTGNLTKIQKQKYLNATTVIRGLPLWINDKTAITTDELALDATLLKYREGLGPRIMGFTDYAELVGDYDKDETKRLTRISQKLNNFARDNNSIEFLVTQYPEIPEAHQIGGTRAKYSRGIPNSCKVFLEFYNLQHLIANPYKFPNFDPNAIPAWADKSGETSYILVHKHSEGDSSGQIPVRWIPETGRILDLENVTKEGHELYSFMTGATEYK